MTGFVTGARQGAFGPTGAAGRDHLAAHGVMSGQTGGAAAVVPAGSTGSDSLGAGGPGTDKVDELIGLGPSIYRVILSIVRDRTLAEDLTQETLVKAWSHLGTFRGESSLRVWVMRIANNVAISALRRRRDQPTDPLVFGEVLDDPATNSPPRRAESRAMLTDVWTAIDGLDPLSRAIVVLREVEQMAYEDIAASLGVALPTVKTRLFRARRELAGRLEGWR